jgi:formamidopyrimidine-DNA glycosylase
MPELPDVELYLESLRPRVLGKTLERVRVANPFVLRSVEPPLASIEGGTVRGLRRVGKRLVFEMDDKVFLVVHLMIAGRLLWKEPRAPIPKKLGLAGFDFSSGTLILTEAGSTRRASIRLAKGEDGLEALDPGGLEVFEANREEFREALTCENHTIKRALTDPRLFSGIGNAYSDEILHRARMSPMKLTKQLTEEECDRVFEATKQILSEWVTRLREQTGEAFPTKVTAFRPGMAVHGRYGQPCPVCGSAVQRIVYAANECNYCATCQTQGKRLADRAMSRLLKEDWPRSLDDWEAHLAERRSPGS